MGDRFMTRQKREVHVEGGNVADSETISCVHIGQTYRRADNARQCSDVGQLFHGGQEAPDTARVRNLVFKFVEHERCQSVVYVKARGCAHVGDKVEGDLVGLSV